MKRRSLSGNDEDKWKMGRRRRMMKRRKEPSLMDIIRAEKNAGMDLGMEWDHLEIIPICFSLF
jgi:hypothetical protein